MPHAPVRYRVDDQSVLLGLYQRLLWDWLTPRIPAFITPNALTAIGQVLGVAAAVACAFAVAGQPAFYFVSAVSIMVSLTLDNVDGAHARRTGQCSRRGELLDHGLDGITSTSVLVMTGLLLHMSAIAMGIFVALGALTFASVFWEQFRTGTLLLPKVGPTEGVSAVALWEVMVAIFGEPAWLAFAPDRLTAGTVVVAIVVLAHAVAVLPPFYRASKRGVSGWEIAPLFASVAVQLIFLVMGADAIVVASTMGLLCAHATCHFIVLRHRSARGGVLPPSLYLAALPIPALLIMPGAAVANAAALAALGLTVAGYAYTLARGWTLLGAR